MAGLFPWQNVRIFNLDLRRIRDSKSSSVRPEGRPCLRAVFLPFFMIRNLKSDGDNDWQGGSAGGCAVSVACLGERRTGSSISCQGPPPRSPAPATNLPIIETGPLAKGAEASGHAFDAKRKDFLQERAGYGVLGRQGRGKIINASRAGSSGRRAKHLPARREPTVVHRFEFGETTPLRAKREALIFCWRGRFCLIVKSKKTRMKNFLNSADKSEGSLPILNGWPSRGLRERSGPRGRNFSGVPSFGKHSSRQDAHSGRPPEGMLFQHRASGCSSRKRQSPPDCVNVRDGWKKN